MADLLYRVLKVSAIIAVCGVFMVAINILLGLMSVSLSYTIVGEVFGILSCCLPFDASVVFSAMASACAGVLAFLVASKIFDLTSWGINSA